MRMRLEVFGLRSLVFGTLSRFSSVRWAMGVSECQAPGCVIAGVDRPAGLLDSRAPRYESRSNGGFEIRIAGGPTEKVTKI